MEFYLVQSVLMTERRLISEVTLRPVESFSVIDAGTGADADGQIEISSMGEDYVVITFLESLDPAQVLRFIEKIPNLDKEQLPAVAKALENK